MSKIYREGLAFDNKSGKFAILSNSESNSRRDFISAAKSQGFIVDEDLVIEQNDSSVDIFETLRARQNVLIEKYNAVEALC